MTGLLLGFLVVEVVRSGREKRRLQRSLRAVTALAEVALKGWSELLDGHEQTRETLTELRERLERSGVSFPREGWQA